MIDQLLQKSARLIEKSGSILIIPGQLLTNETLGASFGLALFLEASGKKTDVLISSDLNEKSNIFSKEILVKPSSIISEIYDPRAFVIKINTKEKPASQLKYDSQEDYLKVIIDSEKINFTPEDISFEYTPFNYDLIITIGVGNFKNLGDIYQTNKDFFEQTPLININNKPITDAPVKSYPINLVNQSVASKSEIIYPLLKNLNSGLINKNIANWLAFSLIEATNNFSKSNPSNQTFNIFSELMARGAQKEKLAKITETKADDELFNLINKIFSLKSLTKIKNNLFIKIPNDFLKGEVTKKTLLELAMEISFNFPKIGAIFLFLKKNGEFIVSAYIKNVGDIEKIQNKIGGAIYENCIFAKIKASSVDEAEQKIITLMDISW